MLLIACILLKIFLVIMILLKQANELMEKAEQKETEGSINIDPDFVKPGERKI